MNSDSRQILCVIQIFFVETDLRAIPTWRLWCDRRYNRLTIADCTADHPVGMAY